MPNMRVWLGEHGEVGAAGVAADGPLREALAGVGAIVARGQRDVEVDALPHEASRDQLLALRPLGFQTGLRISQYLRCPLPWRLQQ